MARLLKVVATTLVTLTVAISAIADCLATEMRVTDRMACCVKGEQDCGPSMQAGGCCTTSRDTQPTLIGEKPAASAKPLMIAVLTPVTATTSLSVSNLPTSRSLVLTAASPPLFLLASSLRI